MLIDTHAHLYWNSFANNLDEVLKNAQATGVNLIINIGTDLETSQKAIKQAKTTKFPKIYCAIGIHPHAASNYISEPGSSIQNDIQKLEKLYCQNKNVVIQIGECGLDYVINEEFITHSASKEDIVRVQKDLLAAQINLAKKLNLPLSIHCRDDRSQNPPASAWDEIPNYLIGAKGILHCYSGLPHNTKHLIHNTEFLISFAGNITYPKNEYLKNAVKEIPLDRIVLETDCPFLSPQSKRGQRNEPSNIEEIAQTIAEIKGISFEEVAFQTTNNVKRLFKL